MGDSSRSVWLDVSAEEAPQPFMRTTAALRQLPNGAFLHLYHRMRPCHLYDFLQQHHFLELTYTECDGAHHLYIWRSGDTAAEAAAEQAYHDSLHHPLSDDD
ncbi:MAG: DUF2249 domain-containing protein [Gammaproteobacteria bacterium]|nr:DUF2249 domain-containing protein [Gammaproteobacteria bacterium]